MNTNNSSGLITVSLDPIIRKHIRELQEYILPKALAERKIREQNNDPLRIIEPVNMQVYDVKDVTTASQLSLSVGGTIVRFTDD